MISTVKDAINEGIAWDKNRDSFTGEHLVVLAAGVALLLVSKRSSSLLVRTIGLSLATTLMLRAASGHDGVAKLLPYLPMANKLLR